MTEAVFERFARLHTPRTDGTGLGLSIVAAITAAHGGTVQVTDAPGGGAAFVIALPLVVAGPAAVRDHAVNAARTSAEKGARHEPDLIAEDEPILSGS